MLTLLLQITRIDLHHKLQLLIEYVAFFLDYRLLYLRFLLLTLSMCFFCIKRYNTKTIVVLILKYLDQQRNTYSKSTVASLLTTCSMSKTLFKCFWCTMNMSLFTAMFLLLRFLFGCIYCQF